jgi:hypothetical protein
MGTTPATLAAKLTAGAAKRYQAPAILCTAAAAAKTALAANATGQATILP